MFHKADTCTSNSDRKFNLTAENEKKNTKVQWARKIFNDDWADLYGLVFTNNKIPTPFEASEIRTLNPDQIRLTNYVLRMVGRVPYHDTFSTGTVYAKNDNDFSIFLKVVDGDSKGRVLSGLNKETFGTYVLYNQGYVGSYQTKMSVALNTARGVSATTRDKLECGDMAYNSSTGEVVFIVSKNGNSFNYVTCSDNNSSVVMKKGTLSNFTNFYSLTKSVATE